MNANLLRRAGLNLLALVLAGALAGAMYATAQIIAEAVKAR